MTKARNISDLLDANGDVKSGALDNVPPSNDASALTTGTIDNARISLDANEIPNLDTSKITSGQFADARIADVSATKLTGTIPDARFPATLPAISGANLTGISGGTYNLHAYDSYNYQTNVGGTTSQDYLDIAGGNTVTFTPTHADDLILFLHGSTIYTGHTTGGDVYMNLGTSSTLGSGDTKLNYDGRSTYGTNVGASVWFRADKAFVLPCTSLTVGTQYYAEQAAATYSTGNWWYINYQHTNASGNHRSHNVEMFHYKKS